MISWYYIYNYYGLNPYVIHKEFLGLKGQNYLWYSPYWNKGCLGKDMHTFLLRNLSVGLKNG